MAEVVTTANQSNFSSRTEMLQWINDTLKIQLKKIEHLGTGAVYCQLFDSIHPGKVQMQKVNWKAKYENDYMANFKILQIAFEKSGVNKQIDVPKLIKCKYQDNLELLQWMKKFHDQFRKNTEKPYDPVARRKGEVFCCDHFGQSDKLPLPTSSSSAAQSHVPLVALNILDTSANGSMNRYPTTGTNQNRRSGKKSQTMMSASAAAGAQEKQHLSHSFQSSLSNNSIDQDQQMFDDVHIPVGQTTNAQSGANNLILPSLFEKDMLVTRLRDERDFYYKKIESVDHMLDGIVDNVTMTPLQMKTFIKTILYTTRDNILTIHDDGTVTLTDENANPIGLEQFETFEGLEQLQNEILATDNLISKSDKKKRSKPPKAQPLDNFEDNHLLNIIPNSQHIAISPIAKQAERITLSVKTPVNSEARETNNGQGQVTAAVDASVQDEKVIEKEESVNKLENNRSATQVDVENQSSNSAGNNGLQFNPPPLTTGSSSFNLRKSEQEQVEPAAEEQFQFEDQLLMQTNNDEDLLSDLEE